MLNKNSMSNVVTSVKNKNIVPFTLMKTNRWWRNLLMIQLLILSKKETLVVFEIVDLLLKGYIKEECINHLA